MVRSEEQGARGRKTRSARVPPDDELRWITERAVVDIIPRDEFIEALKSGRALRLKMGFDPSAPDLTLGHAVGLRKLRQLQDLGHTIVVIVGDWTARIGDPSGQSRTRPMLTADQVKANAETYLRQFSKIVDRELTEIRWQSEWFDEFTLTTVVSLATKFTVAQMLERGDFSERFAARKPIGIHELFYPLLQAYDSVAVEADVEFGGTDQTFNLLVGRQLQPEFGQKPQAVFTVPLLVGTDGVKMSKSQGNYVALNDPPHDMYGKLMSITDQLVGEYFELLTDVPVDELAGIREAVERGGAGARDQKMRLAHEIVSQFHGASAAQQAEEEFRRVFSRGETPEEAHDLRVPFDGAVSIDIDLAELLASAGIAASKSEVRRLVSQGAVEANGVPVEDIRVTVRRETMIRVGRHRFVRVVDSDRTAGAEG
ncbi:MAG: tyrosine--tRNA ligase [Chloroflexi bacterium]|nr:MAG: tyrosine--tRNA ligase [Chloroflexota bacterium]